MLIQLPAKPWKTSWYHYQQLDQALPSQAAVPGPAVPVREHVELSPGSPGCLCCPKIPECGPSSWLYPNCITLLVGERFVCEPVLSGSSVTQQSSNLYPGAGDPTWEFGCESQPKPWTTDWPEPPKTEPGCPASPCSSWAAAGSQHEEPEELQGFP